MKGSLLPHPSLVHVYRSGHLEKAPFGLRSEGYHLLVGEAGAGGVLAEDVLTRDGPGKFLNALGVEVSKLLEVGQQLVEVALEALRLPLGEVQTGERLEVGHLGVAEHTRG